jgi:hypothetical protein
MVSNISYIACLLCVLCIICASCQVQVNEEDKVFHAAPLNADLGGSYFSLYKGNKYQFCDGDFMDPGCYTGDYHLLSDTITLHKLKKHFGISTNRFLIRHYKDMDSSYWQWKYPGDDDEWERMRHMDMMSGATGDVLPLSLEGEIVFDRVNYFVIRMDEMKNSD